MPAQFPSNGAKPQKDVKSASLYTGRFFFGLCTNRAPLRGMQTAMMEKFYGGQTTL